VGSADGVGVAISAGVAVGDAVSPGTRVGFGVAREVEPQPATTTKLATAKEDTKSFRMPGTWSARHDRSKNTRREICPRAGSGRRCSSASLRVGPSPFQPESEAAALPKARDPFLADCFTRRAWRVRSA